jgi:CheY-like chemotaxis protein
MDPYAHHDTRGNAVASGLSSKHDAPVEWPCRSRPACHLVEHPGKAIMPHIPTLLVADDDPLVPRITAKALGRKGWEVVAAQQADRALALARAESPDAITLDLHLPGGDDLALLTRLKADAATASIPVIIVSGDVDRGTAATKAGAYAFLAKPVDLEALYRTLCEATGTEYGGPLGVG